jgi:hypothetical protein
VTAAAEPATTAAASAGASGVAAGAAASPAAHEPARTPAPETATAPTGPAATAASGASSASAPAQLQQPNNGRRTTQSAQLTLSTQPAHVDDVAQEVLNVAGQEHAIVRTSTVTSDGGPSGYAQFQLSVPSANLPATMSALSALQYANVVSRTDSSQDVNDQYLGTQNQLNDAQALRTALLGQLANAQTQAQIDSLNAQIKSAEQTIAQAQSQLRTLDRQINFSPVSVMINAGAVTPVPAHKSGGGGFTFGKAAHDAGRVLTVGAGGALIALAALLPVAVIAGLAWWAGSTIRRRRREQALDMA